MDRLLEFKNDLKKVRHEHNCFRQKDSAEECVCVLSAMMKRINESLGVIENSSSRETWREEQNAKR